MKRKNLILSLICSILVAVTMISFTVYSLVAPTSKNNQNIGEWLVFSIGGGELREKNQNLVSSTQVYKEQTMEEILHICKTRVDFPIPGSPPKRTKEPSTSPPPKTLFNSSYPVSNLFF